MSIVRRALRLILLATLAVVIFALSAVFANELFPGSTSRLYSFMHRVPYEQDGYGTEYQIGRVYIVHHPRLIRPLGSVRFAVEGQEPATLVGSGFPSADPSSTIRAMVDKQYPQIPPDIRAAWAQSVNGLVQRAVRDGPDAATAFANQERDAATFSYTIPDSGIPIPEEIIRRGRVVIYPPSLKITGNPIGFLIIWLVVVAILAAAAKVIADGIRRRRPTISA